MTEYLGVGPMTMGNTKAMLGVGSTKGGLFTFNVYPYGIRGLGLKVNVHVLAERRWASMSEDGECGFLEALLAGNVREVLERRWSRRNRYELKWKQ